MRNIYDYSEADEIADEEPQTKFLDYMADKAYTFDNALKYVKEVMYSPGFGSHTEWANVAESLLERFRNHPR